MKVGVCSALAADKPSISKVFVMDCIMFEEFAIVYLTYLLELASKRVGE